ncbi:MAG: hypothetical protein BRC45_05500 [Cyanobacteria bacterium QS_5_48_63]|nr:MAG: hypothetical protein BRC45_05500 [Cyanobacteria bacterium QS_5_48_63]
MLIVQGRKLFTIFNFSPSEDLVQEQNVINFFLEELELKLEWYKYITSTGKRNKMGREFAKFARENLPEQESINPLKYQYLKQNFPSPLRRYSLPSQKTNALFLITWQQRIE